MVFVEIPLPKLRGESYAIIWKQARISVIILRWIGRNNPAVLRFLGGDRMKKEWGKQCHGLFLFVGLRGCGGTRTIVLGCNLHAILT